MGWVYDCLTIAAVDLRGRPARGFATTALLTASNMLVRGLVGLEGVVGEAGGDWDVDVDLGFAGLLL